mmetsp:Transcript_1734/g.3468  ORF Transcript_1734/g.3468 Transcript_1734/m.3468 type:complete len:131 (-) Transcript_1734:894-1286(-)
MPPRSKSQLKLQKSPCTVLKNKDKGLISTQSAKINVGKGCKRTHGEFTAKTHVQVLGGVERRREFGRPIAVLVPTELHVDHLVSLAHGGGEAAAAVPEVVLPVQPKCLSDDDDHGDDGDEHRQRQNGNEN